MNQEHNIHEGIAHFINIQHPGVLFNVDLSGMHHTKVQAKQSKALRKVRGFPDIQIYETDFNKQYHGLFIELKTDESKVLTKGGRLVSDIHIIEQFYNIKHLNSGGYMAVFGFSQADTIRIIEYYLSGRGLLPDYLNHLRIIEDQLPHIPLNDLKTLAYEKDSYDKNKRIATNCIKQDSTYNLLPPWLQYFAITRSNRQRNRTLQEQAR
jgi:hypothetical protein